MKPFRSQFTLTICLVAILLWTGSPSHAGQKYALVIKAKQQHAKQARNRKNSFFSSDQDLKKSQSGNDKGDTAPELKQENLQIEVLTCGKWIPLDISMTPIETSNQPLRISYHHFQKTPDKFDLQLTLKQHEDRFTIEEAIAETDDKAETRIRLKSIGKISAPYGYLAQDQLSAIFPRLIPGSYSLEVTPSNEPKSKNNPEIWLKVSDAPPEPPIISSFDQRLAREKGKLHLRLKNVVLKDKVTIFVNGLKFSNGERKINKKDLNGFLKFDRTLPPGTSKVIARIEREGEFSDYSKPVSVTSRSTVILKREIDVNKTDFLKSSANKLEESRTLSEKKFTKLRQDDKKDQKKSSKQDRSFDFFPIFQFSIGDNFTLLPLNIQQNPELKESIESLERQIKNNETQIGELKASTDNLKTTIENLVGSLTQDSFIKRFRFYYLKFLDSQQRPSDRQTFEQPQEENTSAADSGPIETNDPEEKIVLQEYAFPYPAAFPISRFSRSGTRIKTEGAVLDQMRLAISKNGQFQLDFDARTTMRVEIKLQLFIKLKNDQWYPITLPKQTILPANSTNNRFRVDNRNQTSFVSITGYAPILVNQLDQIDDIRRRGSATFGSRPVDSSY